MSTCRFSPNVDCLGHGTLSIDSCSAEHCSGPVDLTAKPIRPERKPGRKTTTLASTASLPPRESKPMEVKTMAAKNTGGACDRCRREFDKLSTTKYAEGHYCLSCNVMLQKCGRQGRTPPPYGSTGQRATKAHDAAKAKASTPSKPAAKTPAPVPPPPAPILTRADLAGTPTRSTARLVFSLPIPAGTTALELMDLLRSVPSTAVVEG